MTQMQTSTNLFFYPQPPNPALAPSAPPNPSDAFPLPDSPIVRSLQLFQIQTPSSRKKFPNLHQLSTFFHVLTDKPEICVTKQRSATQYALYE